jgi:hypothetical protein
LILKNLSKVNDLLEIEPQKKNQPIAELILFKN